MPDSGGSSKEIQIGGQAVIEGVVMRGPDRWALAVRRPRGDIFVEVNPTRTLAQRYPRANVFLVRGIFALVDSLVVGIKCITISGGISLEDEEGEEPGGENGGKGEAKGRQDLSSAAVAFSLFMALMLFLGLFIVVPTVIARYLQHYVPNTVLFNLIEGGIRIAIFVLYLGVVGFLPDIRRVFEYHGAEHKTVHAYEHGQALTPESTGRFSTAHMRCGTSFIVIVFIVSILVFSLFGKQPLLLRIVSRVAIIPLIAAISYEIIRFAGRHESSPAVRFLMAPGLLFQKLTTREPDDEQLEVAIGALEAAIGETGGDEAVATR